MARGFGSTLGSATSDVVTSTLTTYPQLRSYFAWIYMRVAPSATSYRIFQHGATNVTAFFPNTDGFCYFAVEFSAGQALWRFPLFSGTTWHAIGVTFDNGSDLNNPIFYLNNTKPTVDESTSSSGTAIDIAGSAFYIGNSSAFDRPFDGIIAEFAIWDAILTDAEYLSLNAGYSPMLIRPDALVEYIPMVRDATGITSRKRAAPTISGTAVQPHPRIIMPRKRRAVRPAPPPPPEILFAQACL